MAQQTARRVEPHESFLELLDPRPLAMRHKLGILALVVLAVAPFYVSFLTLQRLTLALYIGMFAMSWDVVSGYTGEISFGHAFFFALGGYTSVVLSTSLGLSPLVTIVLGVVVAALGGVLIGVPALRVSGPYLSLITLIAPLLLLQVFVIFSDTFGGETGLSPPPAIVGTREDSVFTISNDVGALSAVDAVRVLDFYLAYVLFVVILVGLLVITRSNAGAVFYAIRSGEDVVAATGKNPAKFKIFVFVLSAAVGGLAGGFLAHSGVGGATPGDLLNLELSLLVIIASVLGGMGTIVGAAIGGVFVHMFEVAFLDAIDEEFSFLFVSFDMTWFNDLVGYQISDMSFMLLGVAALVIVYVFPGGLLRKGIELGDTWQQRLTDWRGES